MTQSPKISNSRIVMYTQALCGYCAAAKRLLDAKGATYDTVDVTMDAERRREMMERSGRRTVPQIFIGDRHIGGYDDMVEIDKSGELDALLDPEGSRAGKD